MTRLDARATADAYATYRRREGGRPDDDEELTAEQLAGLHAVFASQGPPYVDFSIWGPYENRTARRLKFVAQELHADGSWHAREIYGPPSYEAWFRAWAVFRAGCLMLKQISLASLRSRFESLFIGPREVHWHEFISLSTPTPWVKNNSPSLLCCA